MDEVSLVAPAGAMLAVAGMPFSANAMGSDSMPLDSSIAIAGGEEALFYVFILLATLITLALSVVLREAPRV